MNKPKAVKPGDTLGLVGPSGAIRTDDGLERAIKVLKDFGYNVKVGASAGARYGYLSGTDELRARDLNDMFMDDEVDAIICTKGGYGTPRILDRLDFDAAKKHPKLFLGYSDITALLLAYGKYADLVTFHGPMPSSCMSNGDFDEYSKAHFLKAISSTEPLGEMRNCACQKLNCLNAGQVRAPMVGGNLSLVEETLGTPKGFPHSVVLGEGPTIKIMDTSLICNPQVVADMRAAADRAGVKYQDEVLTGGGTDGAAMQLTRGGVPSGVISIPCRYVHTPVEMVEISDVEGAVKILKELVK